MEDDWHKLDDYVFDLPDTPKALKCKHGFSAKKAFGGKEERVTKTSHN